MDALRTIFNVIEDMEGIKNNAALKSLLLKAAFVVCARLAFQQQAFRIFDQFFDMD